MGHIREKRLISTSTGSPRHIGYGPVECQESVLRSARGDLGVAEGKQLGSRIRQELAGAFPGIDFLHQPAFVLIENRQSRPGRSVRLERSRSNASAFRPNA
jgi:hypothetical protein